MEQQIKVGDKIVFKTEEELRTKGIIKDEIRPTTKVFLLRHQGKVFTIDRQIGPSSIFTARHGTDHVCSLEKFMKRLPK